MEVVEASFSVSLFECFVLWSPMGGFLCFCFSFLAVWFLFEDTLSFLVTFPSYLIIFLFY